MKKKKLDLQRQVLIRLVDPKRLPEVRGRGAEEEWPTWDLKTLASRLTCP